MLVRQLCEIFILDYYWDEPLPIVFPCCWGKKKTSCLNGNKGIKNKLEGPKTTWE